MKEDGEQRWHKSEWPAEITLASVCLSVFQFTLWPFVPVMSRATTPPLFSPRFSHIWQISFLLFSPEKRGKKSLNKNTWVQTFPWDAMCVRGVWPETISCLTFCFVLHRDANCLHDRGSAGKKTHTHKAKCTKFTVKPLCKSIIMMKEALFRFTVFSFFFLESNSFSVGVLRALLQQHPNIYF